MQNADVVLLALLVATNEAEEKQLQDELLLEHAAPVIRQTLRQRMRPALGYAETAAASVDDLFNDVYVRLLEKLNELRTRPEQSAIRNFSLYVARVTANTCNDYLRSRKQERHRLKHKLRNLLDRHPDFRTWQRENHAIYCGLATWELIDVPCPITSEDILAVIEKFRTTIFVGKAPLAIPLSRIVAETFWHIGHAITLEQLVEIVAEFQGIRDRLPESLDAAEGSFSQRLPDATPGRDLLIEGQEMLQEYWEEIQRLPPDQRATICLSFADEAGEDLFSLLFAAGIATIPELATALGKSKEQFVDLWARVPMLDNTELAAYLGASRQQVSLWRFRAQSRLRKWLLKRKK